jgi:hypothetical protein
LDNTAIETLPVSGSFSTFATLSEAVATIVDHPNHLCYHNTLDKFTSADV